MPLVNLTINERSYAIACDEGQEEHLRELAAHVDAKARELVESAGEPGPQRLLLMAALLIADEYFESKAELDKRAQSIAEAVGDHDSAVGRLAQTERSAVAALDAAAARVEEVAGRLPGA